MKTVKVNHILDVHNNGKKYFETVNAKNWTKIPKIWGKFGKNKNSLKPAKKQSDRHRCFIDNCAP